MINDECKCSRDIFAVKGMCKRVESQYPTYTVMWDYTAAIFRDLKKTNPLSWFWNEKVTYGCRNQLTVNNGVAKAVKLLSAAGIRKRSERHSWQKTHALAQPGSI